MKSKKGLKKIPLLIIHFRYANKVENGNEVLVEGNNKLTAVKIIKTEQVEMQGECDYLIIFVPFSVIVNISKLSMLKHSNVISDKLSVSP